MDDRNHVDMSIDDLLAGGELLATRLGYCPQIDKDTRGILQALAEDMRNHQGTIDLDKERDQWHAAMFMAEILEDILSRNHENTRLPESVVWLDRYR